MPNPYYGAFTQAEAITPSDDSADNFDWAPRAIWVGTSGDIAVVLASGDAVTFTSVPVGWFEAEAVRINSTGTTASDMIRVR